MIKIKWWSCFFWIFGEVGHDHGPATCVIFNPHVLNSEGSLWLCGNELFKRVTSQIGIFGVGLVYFWGEGEEGDSTPRVECLNFTADSVIADIEGFFI